MFNNKQREENVVISSIWFLLLGCTISGYYGENCSTSCPENCLDGLCDTVNGSCYACIDGYSGPTCHRGYWHQYLIFIETMWRNKAENRYQISTVGKNTSY